MNRGSDLINNPPFEVPVQVSRDFEALIPQFTGYTLEYATVNSRKNGARRLFLELLDSNDDVLQKTVQALADLTEYFVTADNVPNGRIHTVLRECAEIVGNAYLAYAIKQYPNEFGPELTDQMVEEIPNYIGLFENHMLDAKEFYNQGRRGGGSFRGSGGRDNGFRSGGNSRFSGHDERGSSNSFSRRRATHHVGSGGGRERDTEAVWQDAGRRLGHRQDTSTGSGFGRRRNINEIREEQEEAAAPARNSNGRPAGNSRRTGGDPNVKIINGQTFHAARQGQEWPVTLNPERPWDWVVGADGTQLRPAHLSDWKVTYDPKTPHQPWYDPDAAILFHAMDKDGKVTTALIARDENDSMAYLDHELSPALRARAHDQAMADLQKETNSTAWEQVKELRPVPEKPLSTVGEVGDDDASLDVKVSTDQYVIVTDLKDGLTRELLKARSKISADIMDNASEFYFDRAVLTDVETPNYRLLYDLTNCTSFTDLRNKLLDADGGEDSELVLAVNRRMTAGINKAMAQKLGLRNYTISDFMDDFIQLTEFLKEDFGVLVAEALLINAKSVISASLAFFSPDEQKDVAVALRLEELDQLPLVWRERVSVTRLPVDLDDLQLPTDDGMAVTKNIGGDLYETFKSIFERATDTPIAHHTRYLVGSDGKALEVLRGALDRGSIVLYKADIGF